MFLDIDKIVSSDKEKQKVPRAILNMLNEDLKDIEYKDENGECVLTSDNISVSGLLIVVDANMQKYFGKSNITQEEALEYSYNTQRPIAVKYDADDVRINGNKIGVDKIVVNPRNIRKETVTKMFIYPPKFSEEDLISLSDGIHEIQTKVKRVAGEKPKTRNFQSVEQQLLDVKYELDGIEKKISINVNINQKCAKSVTELIEAYKIYNAFITGKGIFNGQKLDRIYKNNAQVISHERIKVWEMAEKLESILKIKFTIPENDLSMDEILNIEKLYVSLALGQPYRLGGKIDSLTGYIDAENLQEYNESIGNKLLFAYQDDCDYQIMGIPVKLPLIRMVFGVILEKIEENAQIKLICKGDIDSYASEMILVNLNDNAREKNEIEYFQNAKTLDEWSKIICSSEDIE